MAIKLITSCLGGLPFGADFGPISGINNGDVLYLTFVNSLIDGCYTVDADDTTFTEVVNTTTPSFVDCVSCLATITTPTPTPTQTTTPSYTEYTITTFGYATTNDACASLNPGVTIYAEPGNTVPINGMTFYDNTGLTIPYNGGSLSQYYLLTRGATTWAAQVNTSGVLTDYVICASVSTPTPTTTLTATPTTTLTATPTPTTPLIWYQIFDCNDSSVGFSIAYTAGSFSLNERCTAVNVLTKTVIIIGSTGTLPGGILYTLTSLGTSGCPSTPVPTETQTQTPTQTPSQTPTTTPLYVEYQISSFGEGDANLACATLSSTGPVYASPIYNVPMVGMVFYDDTNLTIPHNGGGTGQWFLLVQGVTTWAAQVNTIGELTNISACATLTTPTPTPSSTPTVTPTSTPPFETCAFLTVRTDSSLDVPITGVEVNSVPVTYLSGETFTIIPSDPPGYFNTTQTGASVTVVVNYGSNIAGQRIVLVDCDAVVHCCDLNSIGGTCTFTGVDLSCNWPTHFCNGHRAKGEIWDSR
jgi:hypothetical protein